MSNNRIGRLDLVTGGIRFFTPPAPHATLMEIAFDPVHVAFVCQPEGATEPVSVSARGLTKDDLMGDLPRMLALPAYQLVFPFSPEEQRRLAFVE